MANEATRAVVASTVGGAIGGAFSRVSRVADPADILTLNGIGASLILALTGGVVGVLAVMWLLNVNKADRLRCFCVAGVVGLQIETFYNELPKLLASVAGVHSTGAP